MHVSFAFGVRGGIARALLGGLFPRGRRRRLDSALVVADHPAIVEVQPQPGSDQQQPGATKYLHPARQPDQAKQQLHSLSPGDTAGCADCAPPPLRPAQACIALSPLLPMA